MLNKKKNAVKTKIFCRIEFKVEKTKTKRTKKFHFLNVCFLKLFIFLPLKNLRDQQLFFVKQKKSSLCQKPFGKKVNGIYFPSSITQR
jgi:hypothetical protein